MLPPPSHFQFWSLLFESQNPVSEVVKLNQEKTFPFRMLAITCGIIPPAWTPSNSAFTLSCGNGLAAISLLAFLLEQFSFVWHFLSTVHDAWGQTNKSEASSRVLRTPVWFISLQIPCHVKLWKVEGVVSCFKTSFLFSIFQHWTRVL